MQTKPSTYTLSNFAGEDTLGMLMKKNYNASSRMKMRPIRLKRSYNRKDAEDKRII